MIGQDIGIDLGTANIIITLGKKGIVLNEPSVIAYDKRKKRIVAVGSEAYRMIGRTPEYIVAVHPLKDGVISDSDMTDALIKYFIKKVGGISIAKPRIVLCIPSTVTDMELRAVIEAALSSGARSVYLIEEPIAALIGAGIDITKPNGNMVVDIGGGTADVAVVSFNGVVQSKSVKMAGSKFDQAIIRFVSGKHKILIGDKTAEDAKIKLTNVFNPTGEKTMTVKGRHLITGLPTTIQINDLDIKEALIDSVDMIVELVKAVLETTPPELVGDIMQSGVVLTGGGALLGGLAEHMSEQIGAPCYVAENAIECVARGVERSFTLSKELLDGFQHVSIRRYK